MPTDDPTGPVNITFDVTKLSYKETQDYRQELIRALYNPGTDWSPLDENADDVEKGYRAQLLKADEHLASFNLGDAPTGIEATRKLCALTRPWRSWTSSS
jgi:hypothetical protein